jgi:hypothetical protein
LQPAIVNSRDNCCPHRGLPLVASLPSLLASFPLLLDAPLSFEVVELPLEVVENRSYEWMRR